MKSIPACGFGTYRLRDKVAYDSVLHALKTHKHIDTANLYKNEAEIGKALRDSGVEREDVWITTKVQLKDIIKGKDAIYNSIVNSLEQLDVPYIDLVLLHGPAGDDKKLVESWCALEEMILGNIERLKGKVRYIGVSNYNLSHLKPVMDSCRIKPYANQIEVSPYLNRSDVIDYCKENGIVVVAHTSLIKGEKFGDQKLEDLSKRIGISKPLILLAWGLHHGMVVLPRSSKVDHIDENWKCLDVKLDNEVVSELDEFYKVDRYCTHPKYVE